ncbi:MAG: NUDIX domain-containing protein [Sandaracinaceae bacterium]|nr:NUDIX domain-containing protein [Sandaracinaceae bacterium]
MLDIDPLRDGPTPVPAATVILLRDGADGLEVLLVQRHRATAFMGGAYVFPGGKLDPSDAGDAIRAHLPALDEQGLLASLADDGLDATTGRALFVAAARETFEEAGLLIGTTTRSDALPRERERLNAGTSFAEVLDALDAVLSLDRLVPLSRWVTPAVEKRRFDARFFLAEVSLEESQHASVEQHETIASRWLGPAEAVALHLDGQIDLPPPTLRTLELLSRHASAADAVREARQARPPLVRPVFHAPADGWILALPGDPLHPEPARAIEGSTRFVCRDARWFSA